MMMMIVAGLGGSGLSRVGVEGLQKCLDINFALQRGGQVCVVGSRGRGRVCGRGIGLI